MQVLLKIFLALGRIGDRLARIELRQEIMMGLVEDMDAAVQSLVPAVQQLTTAATNLEQRIGSLGLTAEQTAALQGDLDALRNATSSIQEVTSGLDATDPAPTGAGQPASATPGAAEQDGTITA